MTVDPGRASIFTWRKGQFWAAVDDLPGDLAETDKLLDDEKFFEPLGPFFDPVIGWPSIPFETYLSMMFLSTATGSATRRCAARWATPSPGDASVGVPLDQAALQVDPATPEHYLPPA